MDFISVASNFLKVIWDLIVQFFNFLVSGSSFYKEFLQFVLSVVLELPDLLLNIFNSVPSFVQTGFLIVFYGVSFVLILKIIKLIRDVFI